MTNLTALSATVTLVAVGVMTGVFFAFQVSVMPGLDAAGPQHAVPSMQGLNEAILTPVFLATFLGVPLAAGATGGLLLATGHRAAALAFFAAAGVYLLGAFLPTFLVNVPLNDTLMDAGTPEDAAHAARLWEDFHPRWTAWNAARTAFSLVSLLVAALGLLLWRREG